MHVALVSTELGIGGAEQCLTELALRLDRRRFRPAVYSLAPTPDPPRDGLVQRLREAAVEVHFLNCRRPRQFLTACRRLAQHWRAERPAVVQSFLYHANIVAAVTARRLRLPAVALGIRVADPNRTRSRLERWAGRRVQRCVCVSQAVARFAAQQDWPPELLTTIPNGIDVQRFRQAKPTDLLSWGLAPHRSVVTSVGRLADQKGFADLLSALPPFLARFPDVDWLLVGEGPQRQALIDQVNSLGIQDRVVMVGWQPDIAGILAASRLLLLPSRWEGMPNVVLEAMAAGIPVAATAVEGVQEVLGPLADSQTASPSDPAGLLSVASRLLQNEPLSRELGRANYQRVLQHFSLDAMVQAYEDLFRQLDQQTGGNKA